MKRYFQCIYLFMITCSIQNRSPQHLKSIQGTWIDSEDKYSIMKIDRKNYYRIYKHDTTFFGKYWRSSVSCDSNYLNDKTEKNLDFIRLEDGTCYEITGLSDSTLAYRHTTSGKVYLFFRASYIRDGRINVADFRRGGM